MSNTELLRAHSTLHDQMALVAAEIDWLFDAILIVPPDSSAVMRALRRPVPTQGKTIAQVASPSTRCSRIRARRRVSRRFKRTRAVGPSFPQKREPMLSVIACAAWIPAVAGMTAR